MKTNYINGQTKLSIWKRYWKINQASYCPIPKTSCTGNALRRQWCHAVDRYDGGLSNSAGMVHEAQDDVFDCSCSVLFINTHYLMCGYTHTLSQMLSSVRSWSRLCIGVQWPDFLMISPPRSSIKDSTENGHWVCVYICMWVWRFNTTVY